MKSCKSKGAYEAPCATPSSLQLEATLLVASNTVLYVDIDQLHNLNFESNDEYFEVGF